MVNPLNVVSEGLLGGGASLPIAVRGWLGGLIAAPAAGSDWFVMRVRRRRGR